MPALLNLTRKISVRWRLIALAGLIAFAFTLSGADLWWHGHPLTDSTESLQLREKALALQKLQTAFGDYRYWQLVGLTEARGNSDARARAKVQTEMALQVLQKKLEKTTVIAPESAQLISQQLQAIKPNPALTNNEAAELRARLDSQYDRIALLAETTTEASAAAKRAGQNLKPDFFVLLGLLSVTGLLATMLIASILGPLDQLVSGAENLTLGALDTYLPVTRDDEIGAVAKALDQFRERARQWDYLAYHDPLTGLANRAKLEQLLAEEIKLIHPQNQGLILLYLGLDQLTAINDTFGPASGDEFLKIAARRLRNSLPETSRLFYVGGSHFVVLPPAIANDAQMIAAADKLARNVVNDMSRSFSLQEQELEMTIKLGVVTCPHDGVSFDELIANAYGALTHARRSPGSSFQFYTQQITEKARQRLSLAAQLRRAVQADELRVHYQPALNVATNQIVAAEALMRWQHPTRGLLMPGEFIQAAEESGAINAMGEWCLTQACNDALHWREAGLEPFKLAVNLSARQLSEPGLVDIIQRTLEHAKMPHSELELEITESTVMHNPESSIRILRHLKSLGISLSVDDFGTGYSSLTYLQRFPLDKIKIDRSFVSRLNRRRKDELIIAATTRLATDLGLEVVAEGVETHDQMQILRQLGCHLMQGYLFSRALPLDDFIKWARNPGAAPQAGVTLN